MNIATAGNPPKIVVDTNVLVSAIIFGGNPRKILQKTAQKDIAGALVEKVNIQLRKLIRKKEVLKSHLNLRTMRKNLLRIFK